jgi:predicted nicotinamide N-methyase
MGLLMANRRYSPFGPQIIFIARENHVRRANTHHFSTAIGPAHLYWLIPHLSKPSSSGLRHRMTHPGFFTKQESIPISGADDLQIRSLLDRQQFSDPTGQAERLGISSATWPLFGLLWPSGDLLAARMAAHPVTEGERILEVGCGLGLASLVSHRRGADITASDCHPLTRDFLDANTTLNHLGPIPYRHGNWGDEALIPESGTPTPLTAVEGLFDLIIGSDLLYDRDASTALAGFIGHHAAPASQIWIIDPDRGNRPAFNKQMLLLGFALTQERLDRTATSDIQAYKGRLLIYTRNTTDCHSPGA